VALDVLEVLEGAGDLPAVDGLGSLAGVLERNTKVGTASAGGLSRLDFGGGVTDLLEDMVRMLLRRWFRGFANDRGSKDRIVANCTRVKDGNIPS
jgi:hypothetical protein